MAGKRRLNLSFSLTSPQQREAWHILSSIPAGKRTDAVCRMVCKAHEQDTLLSAISGLIREELRNLDLTTEKSQQAQAGDMDENVLGFLPVSYTHLDVYKRHVLRWAMAWADMASHRFT